MTNATKSLVDVCMEMLPVLLAGRSIVGRAGAVSCQLTNTWDVFVPVRSGDAVGSVSDMLSANLVSTADAVEFTRRINVMTGFIS